MLPRRGWAKIPLVLVDVAAPCFGFSEIFIGNLLFISDSIFGPSGKTSEFPIIVSMFLCFPMGGSEGGVVRVLFCPCTFGWHLPAPVAVRRWGTGVSTRTIHTVFWHHPAPRTAYGWWGLARISIKSCTVPTLLWHRPAPRAVRRWGAEGSIGNRNRCDIVRTKNRFNIGKIGLY